MTAIDMPTRVVVFASEQLFPTLQFLLHQADRLGSNLAAIHIYCTEDDRRSAGPARRLAAVVRRWLDSRSLKKVSIDTQKGGMWPADVRTVLMEWFEAAPDSHWLINVTGGTKPMSIAATQLALSTNLPSRRVIYQEIGGEWAELDFNEEDSDEGLLEAYEIDPVNDPLIPPPDALDKLVPVEDLVAMQFSEEHRVTTQKLAAFPVDQALMAVIEEGWHGQAGLAALSDSLASFSSGDAFEKFIGAGLLDCGIRLQHSLKVIDVSGKVARELDLVACHKGRLICIDIKLPGAKAEAKGTQLADIKEIAHSLGGRAALAIALRPGWDAPEKNTKDVKTLARALGVHLFTQHDAPWLFTRMLEEIDRSLKPGPAVLAAEAVLQKIHQAGNPVLSDGRLMGDTRKTSGVDHDGSIPLLLEIERIGEQRGEPWGVVNLNGTEFFIGILKARLPEELTRRPDYCQKLEAALLKLHAPENASFEFQNTSAWITVRLKLKSGVKQQAMFQCLRNWRAGKK